MELACASSCSLSVKAACSTSTRADARPYLSFLTNSARVSDSLPKIAGFRLQVKPVRQLSLSPATVVGDRTAAPNDCSGEQLSFPDSSGATNLCEGPKGNDEDKNEQDGVEGVDDPTITRICDKLIGVFMVDKPTPTDWRRLLAFSKEWDDLRPHFYKRCQDTADNEDDPGKKHNLLRLGRKLKEVDEDVQRHNELLEVIKGAPLEMNEVVAKRRKDFTKEFFLHLHTVTESYYENPTEQNALAKLGNMCLASVEAYDTANENIQALNAAELKFQDILNSPSLDAACKKIDNLAEKNQLDSALALMITKAWSAAKETNVTKDEVKDILYHLYMTTRTNLQKQMPKEIRIIKHLLTLEDPEERLHSLKDAFTPGEELEREVIDCLYTTPENLHTMIKVVVDAYNFSQGGLLREARDLMNPEIIRKLEELKKVVEDHFM
ncbi:hypothetical protein HS088_TW11G00330 [Tripterygium wilfordii]|uniref:Uncharacterized protein n=1 Tax=Tripterygium wilfordii TaxID=458696 RepID=A0A7J7D1Q7_TRIWF|nr:uncharacterized protein At4g37920-like [Tripterygium wilfordii]KAF5740264.1 hypothetical protein HS088_TW11G00330 [Tripterygium wilfordii]